MSKTERKYPGTRNIIQTFLKAFLELSFDIYSLSNKKLPYGLKPIALQNSNFIIEICFNLIITAPPKMTFYQVAI